MERDVMEGVKKGEMREGVKKGRDMRERVKKGREM